MGGGRDLAQDRPPDRCPPVGRRGLINGRQVVAFLRELGNRRADRKLQDAIRRRRHGPWRPGPRDLAAVRARSTRRCAPRSRWPGILSPSRIRRQSGCSTAALSNPIPVSVCRGRWARDVIIAVNLNGELVGRPPTPSPKAARRDRARRVCRSRSSAACSGKLPGPGRRCSGKGDERERRPAAAARGAGAGLFRRF